MIKGFNWKNYSSIIIILTNLEATVGNLFHLPAHNLQIKDLRMHSSLEKDVNYSVKRSCTYLGSGQGINKL